jgi:hypothetical protein
MIGLVLGVIGFIGIKTTPTPVAQTQHHGTVVATTHLTDNNNGYPDIIVRLETPYNSDTQLVTEYTSKPNSLPQIGATYPYWERMSDTKPSITLFDAYASGWWLVPAILGVIMVIGSLFVGTTLLPVRRRSAN